MAQDRAGRFEAALLVLLVALTVLAFGLLAAQVRTPQPITLAGLTIDRLSATIALLVAGVGAVVYRFALRYLEGEPRRRFFLRWLAFTVLAAFTLILATNLLLLFGAWLLTSIGLHQLLTYYRDRAAVYPPARKKFLISRLGDVALLGAIGLIAVQWGTLDLNVFLANLDRPTVWGGALHVVALLVVMAALTKSAQFPFHSWLPETLEAPTPVSALMHAGIINAGGVLLLHFAPLLVRAPLALFLLVLVGTLTAVLGMLAMWAQTNVKRTLAWSTVSQMGFMMVQCGLGVFPAAVLHLLGHGLYKARAFLRTGELPPPAPPALKLAPGTALRLALLGTLAALPALALAAFVFGFDPLQEPGKLALLAISGLALGQGWVVCYQAAPAAGRHHILPLLAALALTLGGAFLVVGLYQGAALFYAPVLGDLVQPQGWGAWLTAALPVAAMTILTVLYPVLPAWRTTPAGRAFAVHALHGFYLGIFADRIVARIWRESQRKGAHGVAAD